MHLSKSKFLGAFYFLYLNKYVQKYVFSEKQIVIPYIAELLSLGSD